MIDDALQACGAGLDWETLKKKGWAYVSEAPLILWAEGRFPTPSGKIEIASSRAEADGHPRVPQPSVDAPPAEGRLRLNIDWQGSVHSGFQIGSPSRLPHSCQEPT